MTNLKKFLQAIAAGISEQFDSLEARDGESRESLALREYFSQLCAVADAVGPNETLDWQSLNGRVGIDLEPDPCQGFEPLSADSVEPGAAVAFDADGVPDLSQPPRVVSQARHGGTTVYLEFADGPPGASFAFDEVLWRADLAHLGPTSSPARLLGPRLAKPRRPVLRVLAVAHQQIWRAIARRGEE